MALKSADASPPEPAPATAPTGAAISANDRQDRQLMLQAQRGDLEAFETLFEKYHRPLFNFFLRLGCDRQHAEDFLQEVFLRLWRSAVRYHPSGKFTTYLFQIAKNYWLNERTKLKRHAQQASLDAPIGGHEAEFGSLSQSVADEQSQSPHDAAVNRELLAKLEGAISALDDRHRLVFILARINQFRYREIAEILEIPEGTVKTRMMHAERKLRDRLKGLDPDELEQ